MKAVTFAGTNLPNASLEILERRADDDAVGDPRDLGEIASR